MQDEGSMVHHHPDDSKSWRRGRSLLKLIRVMSREQAVTARSFISCFDFVSVLDQVGRQPQYLVDICEDGECRAIFSTTSFASCKTKMC